MPIRFLQPLLPFEDITTGEAGWQLAVPFQRSLFKDPKAAAQAGVSGVAVMLLFEDGRVVTRPLPIRTAGYLSGESTEPPMPQWAHVPIDVDYGVRYATLDEPMPNWGVLPVADIEARTLQHVGRGAYDAGLFSLTPHGTLFFDVEATSADTESGMRLEKAGAIVSPFPLALGPHEIGTVWMQGRSVLGFDANPAYADAGLWTIHLRRAAIALLT